MPNLIFKFSFVIWILHFPFFLLGQTTSDPPVVITTNPATLNLIAEGPTITFDIIISEPATNDGAFAPSDWGNYKIVLPDNFQFVTNNSFAVHFYYQDGGTWEEYSEIGVESYPTDGTNSFYFQYRLPALGSGEVDKLEKIEITNLSVRALAGATTNNILRDAVGVSLIDASQDGNPTSGAGRISHGTLNVSSKQAAPVFSETIIRTLTGNSSTCGWSDRAFYDTSNLGANNYRLRWYSESKNYPETLAIEDPLMDGIFSLAEMGITSSTPPGEYVFYATNCFSDWTGESDKTELKIIVEEAEPVYLFASDYGPVCPNEPVTFIASPPLGGGFFDSYEFTKTVGTSVTKPTTTSNSFTSTNHTSNFTITVIGTNDTYPLCSVRDKVDIVVTPVTTPAPDDVLTAITESTNKEVLHNQSVNFDEGDIVLTPKTGYMGGQFSGKLVTEYPDGTYKFIVSKANSGINEITYTYSNGGCPVSINFNIEVEKDNNNKILNGEYCISDADVVISLNDTDYSGYQIFSILVRGENGIYVPAPEIKNIGSQWFFSPSNAVVGDYTYYFRLRTPLGIIIPKFEYVSIKSSVNADFFGLDSFYCSNMGSAIQLQPSNPGGTFTFFKIIDTTNKQTLPSSILDINSLGLDTGNYVMRYEFTSASCGNKKERNFEILRAPNISFDFAPGTMPCINTRIEIDNHSDSLSSQFAYTWNFGDNITSNEFEPVHEYSISKEYQISLTVEDKSNGCIVQQTKNITIGAYPKANFEFRNVCSNDPATTFINNTDITGMLESDITWRWDFGDGYILTGTGAGAISTIDKSILNNTTNGSYKIPTHKFKFADSTYRVILSASGKEGCTQYDTAWVSIFPSINVSNIGAYVEKFDSGNNGWISSGENFRGANSSWKLSSPSGEIIKAPSSEPLCWVTNNVNNTYNSNENSWVESPCFVIDGLERPMISVKTFFDIENGYDGAVLQYSTDGITWKLVGDVNQGINWFNSNAISSGPGEQKNVSKGWTGISADSNWVTSKYSLDDVKVDAGGNMVRFRIAFASNDNNANGARFDGFTFDDVYIGERKRVVLMEHFTNISAPNAENEEMVINSYSESGQGIKLQYHTSYPKFDEINSENKADPSARALLYGVAAIPRTVLDGVVTEDEPFSTGWGKAAYSKRTLNDAPFTISIEFDTISRFNIHAYIQKNESETELLNPFVIQIAIVQKELVRNGILYKDVVRKLVPNAAGTRIQGTWQPGEIKEINKTWRPSEFISETDQFKVVVFIQDEKSKEVYQAYQKDIPFELLENFVFTNKVRNSKEQLSGVFVYPNPANQYLNVNLGEMIEDGYTWDLMNYSGNKISGGKIYSGTSLLVVPTSEIVSGLYVLELKYKGQVIHRSKVSIIN